LDLFEDKLLFDETFYVILVYGKSCDKWVYTILVEDNHDKWVYMVLVEDNHNDCSSCFSKEYNLR
jgi:hypothetical protein